MEWLKKLFAGRPQLSEEIVEKDQLGSWVSKKRELFESNMLREANEKAVLIKQEIKKTRENLENLEQAQLKNPKIDPRLINIMQGNRNTYIRTINKFLDTTRFPETLDEYKTFSEEFDKEIGRTAKSTHKPYMILQEFFAHESRKIADNLKKMSDAAKEIHALFLKEGFKSITNIEEIYGKIKENKKLKQDIDNTIKEKDDEIKKYEQEKQKLAPKIQQLKNSPELKAYCNKEKELEQLKQQIKNLEDDFFHSYAVIEKALKKYERIAVEPMVVQDILNYKFRAIINNETSALLNALESMKQAVEKDTIELDKKKKEKTIQEINKLDKDHLLDLKQKYNEAAGRINSSEQELEKNTIVKQLKEAENKLKSSEESIERLQAERCSLKNKMPEDEEELYQKIIKRAKNIGVLLEVK